MAPTDILKYKLLHLKSLRCSLVEKSQIIELDHIIKHIEHTIYDINTIFEAGNYFFSEVEGITDDIVRLGHEIHACKNDDTTLSIIEPLYDRRRNRSNKWYNTFQVTNETCFELAFQITSNLHLLGKFETLLYGLMSINTTYSISLLDDIKIIRGTDIQIINGLMKINEFEEKLHRFQEYACTNITDKNLLL